MTPYTIKVCRAPYSQTVIDEIQSLVDAERRDTYYENYQDVDDGVTLKSLLMHSDMPQFWGLFENDQLVIMSGVRPLDDETLVITVRTISRRDRGSIVPYGAASIAPLQIQWAKHNGYKKVMQSFNTGVRTGNYRRVNERMRNYKGDCPVTTHASKIVQQFIDTGIQTVFSTQQHTLTLDLATYVAPQYSFSFRLVEWK